jgi:mediator of RNA polymerase II transcription subunit 27
LALKAFSDQKRRFFPHLDEDLNSQNTEPSAKKQCGPQVVIASHQEELSDCKTLSDVLARLEKEVPNLKILTYERLDWLKRASSLPSSATDSPMEALKGHSFHSSNRMKPSSLGDVVVDKAVVIELCFPSIFRAVVSGSIDPDAVAFFSPDEVMLFIIMQNLSFFNVYVLFSAVLFIK